MIISQLVKVERETESHTVHESNPGVNRSRAHKGRHVRIPSVDSTEVLKEYLCSGIPQTVCTDVLTGRKITQATTDDSETIDSTSLLSDDGMSLHRSIHSSTTRALLQHHVDFPRQPCAASHNPRIIYKPLEKHGPERLEEISAKTPAKFVYPNKPKGLSPSSKATGQTVAREGSKFQRALAFKAVAYENPSKNKRPKLLEYLENFLRDQSRVRGLFSGQPFRQVNERDTPDHLGNGHAGIPDDFVSLERELDAYFEAYDIFVEAHEGYKSFLLPIKQRSLKLIALYRKEFEKLPELKAKIRATAFNDHEALDDAQKVSAFLKNENKALRGKVAESEAAIQELKKDLMKTKEDLKRAEIQAAEYAEAMQRNSVKNFNERAASQERLKVLARTIGNLEKSNLQALREAERHADLSRIKIHPADHEKVLNELQDLRRSHKVLRSQHNKLSKKTRRLTIHAKASASPTSKSTFKNNFRPDESALFKYRVRDTPHGNFFDTETLIRATFEADWARLCKSGGLIHFIESHDIDAVEGHKKVIDISKECKNIFEQNYRLILHIHQHYASIRDIEHGNNGITSITVDPFCRFLEEIGLFQNQHCSRNACLVIFAEANNESGEDDAKTRVLNDDNALMRFEFIECLVRVAFLCHGEDSQGSTVSSLKILIHKNIHKSKSKASCRRWALDQDNFRRNVLYTEGVEKALRSRNVELRSIYEHYSRIHPIAGHGSRGNLGPIELYRMFFDAHLIQQGLVSNRTLQQMFVRSRLFVVDEVANMIDLVALSYISFLELVSRLASETFDEDEMDAHKLDVKVQLIETFIAELIGGLAENQQLHFSKKLRSIDEWEREEQRGVEDGEIELTLTTKTRLLGLEVTSIEEDQNEAERNSSLVGVEYKGEI